MLQIEADELTGPNLDEFGYRGVIWLALIWMSLDTVELFGWRWKLKLSSFRRCIKKKCHGGRPNLSSFIKQECHEFCLVKCGVIPNRQNLDLHRVLGCSTSTTTSFLPGIVNLHFYFTFWTISDELIMLHFVQVMKAMEKRATTIARLLTVCMYDVLSCPKKCHLRIEIFVEFMDHEQDPHPWRFISPLLHMNKNEGL